MIDPTIWDATLFDTIEADVMENGVAQDDEVLLACKRIHDMLGPMAGIPSQ